MIQLGHPSEEALERFLLDSLEGPELVQLERHILACESCVTRLEEIEVMLAATKLALRHLRYLEDRFFPEARPARPRYLRIIDIQS